MFERELNERMWVRGSDGATVDVHLTLFGADAHPDRVFDVIHSDAKPMDVGGATVAVPSIPARACHLALHAAQHSEVVQRPLDDLTRALEVSSIDTWEQAREVAGRLDALGAFGVGLRLVEPGRAVAATLGLSDGASREMKLFAKGAPPLAVGLEYLRQEPGWSAKARVVGRTLWPPADYLVWRHPWASGGHARRVLARLWHPLWLLKALARAVPAYVRASRRG
jgi:hypothetical protein